MKKTASIIHPVLSLLLATGVATAFAHPVLDEPVALAGTGYKAALRISHGCQGAATTAVQVTIPAGFRGARPMPKAGWGTAIRREPLAKPYSSHGHPITEDVTEITWTAASRDNALPDSHFDEFVLRGTLPAQAGPMWFKVLQTCEKGELNWSEIPASGISTEGLKSPAALLEVLPGGPAGHSH
ncbi:MAG: YcnI family protein [Burkholderiaceae bacterium]|nr:YcnI family protein [Burkholderiaceae bacterium]MDZ4143107.1 YcnI family protein [Burkholderiales bacterium]